MQGSRRLLIVSHGPVPTPEHVHVEGGGLRCWGLARGLRSNAEDLAVTLAYHEHYRKPEFTAEAEGIQIRTWDHESIAAMAREHDAVLISYCMGEQTVRLVRSLREDQQLILDSYVPIFTEVAARDSDDPIREQADYLREIRHWTEPIGRGDLFLCANPAQERYYRGVLSALGRINPLTYGRSLIMEVPYGIDRDLPTAADRPITRMVGDGPAKILWFGGMYPWFDARSLVDAVARVNARRPARLVIVGARNPFNFHPDLLAKYQELTEYVARPEFRDLVILQDWVDFRRRADWYLDADIVVTINRPGEENALSWRTRLVDFAWAGVPVATNGGDPMGEALIAAGAAARFDRLDPDAMAQTLGTLLEDEGALRSLRENVEAFRSRLYWDVVTAPLARAIVEGVRAPDLLVTAPADPNGGAGSGLRGRWMRLSRLARKVPRYLRERGIGETTALIRLFLLRKLRSGMPRTPEKRPGLVVLSHHLDLSGAPYVLVEVLAQLVAEGLGPRIRLFTRRPIHVRNVKRVAELGVKTTLLPHEDAVPPFTPGDVVLLNTAEFSTTVRDAVLDALDRRTLRKALWYIHEDTPDRFFTRSEARRIARLHAEGKLEIVAPSEGARERYERFFGMEIPMEPYRIDLPSRYEAVRAPSDFETLRFIMPGSFLDGRKGQHVILYALSVFDRLHGQTDPSAYRPFTLTYVGLADDWYSEQVVRHRRILGDRLILHPKMTRESTLEQIRAANVTVCYSQSETLPLFVFEGMLAGHPILRNDCSGVDEQLDEERNGYRLDSGDFWQVVSTLERMLNRRKTSNEQLAAMSARSHAIAMEQRANHYELLIGRLRSSLQVAEATVPRPHVLERRATADLSPRDGRIS